jgi:hypothetical protein
MNQPETIKNEQVVEAMEAAVREEATPVMTHLSRGKWHMTKVALKGVRNDMLHIEITPREKPHPINIQVDQPVGMSLKLVTTSIYSTPSLWASNPRSIPPAAASSY